MNLVCFTEEESAKEMLEIILRRIFLDNISFIVISFEGKSDLDKQIEKKIKNWNTPDTVFLIMRDQDSGNCKIIKQDLLAKIENTGKKNNSLVRIACHELESFYLGDLLAVEKAFSLKNIAKKQSKVNYKNPDNLNNAKQELRKIAKNYQPISGSKLISPYLKLNNSNKSTSFNILISGIQKLCNPIIQQ